MKRAIIYIGILFIAITSCKRVIVIVDSIPANTPPGQDLYIAGNFNSWDPGEELFILTMQEDSNYYFTLPPGFGTIEYKFTRGDWTTVEKGLCHEEIENRVVHVSNTDTVVNQILSWNDQEPLDCNSVTICITNFPSNTPVNEGLYLATTFNSWMPNEDYKFYINEFGDPEITITKPQGINSFEFKVTRGDISKSESDEFGNDIENRSIEFGKDHREEITISGWTDLQADKSKNVVFIIRNMPDNTPVNDKIYMASNINSWTQKDWKFRFKQNENGDYYLLVKRQNIDMEFKVLRGWWNTVEVNKDGWDIENRQLGLLSADTVYLDIARWKDINL